MGLSHSWIAVRGCDRAAVLAALGLEETGEEVDFPDRLGATDLPGGWTLLVSSDFDLAFKKWAPALAPLGPTVACAEEEHVMYSEARGYENGVETWRVVRNCEEEPYMHVAVTGDPPPQLEAIRAKSFAEQEAEGGEGAGVDMIFEIPPELAKAICGYRLTQALPGDAEFVELQRARGAAKPGFLQRLFGAR